jgi:hypothetical protein
LCAVCSNGYFMADNSCVKCKASHFLTPSLIVFMLVVGIVVGSVVIVVLIARVRAGRKRIAAQEIIATNEDERKSSVDIESDGTVVSKRKIDTKKSEKSFMEQFQEKMSFVAQLKIIVSTYQIISSTSTTFQVTLPLAFTKAMDAFSFVNSSISSIFPLGCAAQYDFVFKLYINTMVPVMIGIVMVIGFLLEYLVQRRRIQSNSNRQKGDKRKAFEKIKNKYVNVFLYISYLMLPGVSTIIFQTFTCIEVDPDGSDEGGGSSLYLSADTTISCDSSYYKGAVVYACFCVLLYPVAVPLLYFLLLYQARDEISSRQVNMNEEELRLVSKVANHNLQKEYENMTVEDLKQVLNRHHEIFLVSTVSNDVSDSSSVGSTVVENPLTEEEAVRDEDLEIKRRSRSDSCVSSVSHLEETPPGTTVSDKTKRISFLYDAYTLQYW